MKKVIYDNSNIAESYAGCTSPLTFSFISHVYEGVYRNFCRMMGVNTKVINLHNGMFADMVEFIGFRVYYNLSNWYRMLALFPGYKFSSRFMEKMMGVEKEHRGQVAQECGFARAFFLSLKIIFEFSFLGLNMKRFNRYFDKTFSSINSVDLSKVNLKELKDLYGELDQRLIDKWKFPIANDFAVMVSAGLADRLFQKWLNSGAAYDCMDFGGGRSLVTLDPSRKIFSITEAIKRDAAISAMFKSDCEEKELLRLLEEKHSNSNVFKSIRSYIHEFGSRMPNELKLESMTLEENPVDLIKLIRCFMERDGSKVVEKANFDRNVYLGKLGFGKRFFMKWLLAWAANSISRREESRFRRTLIFGYARKLFLAIGGDFVSRGILKTKRDIFYLKFEEMFSVGEGVEQSFFEIVEKRKLEQVKWNKIELPRRIDSEEGVGEIEKKYELENVFNQTMSSDLMMQGRTVSKPIADTLISGIALTLKQFDPSADFCGKILVTKYTDPGWTVVFPLLKGLIVERGGMLSHAAIVARELNIPCIVGVDNATEYIKSGTKIKMDLDNGTINCDINESISD